MASPISSIMSNMFNPYVANQQGAKAAPKSNTVDSSSPNMFLAFSGGVKGVEPTKQPVTPVTQVGSGNPFVPTDDKKTMGVGLVNSTLPNMSYVLPNGQKSLCNTIAIA